MLKKWDSPFILNQNKINSRIFIGLFCFRLQKKTRDTNLNLLWKMLKKVFGNTPKSARGTKNDSENEDVEQESALKQFFKRPLTSRGNSAKAFNKQSKLGRSPDAPMTPIIMVKDENDLLSAEEASSNLKTEGELDSMNSPRNLGSLQAGEESNHEKSDEHHSQEFDEEILEDLNETLTEEQIKEANDIFEKGYEKYCSKDINAKIESIPFFQKSAALGNPKANLFLGICHYQGTTGIVDYQKSFVFFLKSALKGNADGLYNLGNFFKFLKERNFIFSWKRSGKRP
jgi:hypothetical protein